MRAEHAAVGVHLVDHHVLEVLEELRPLGVVRQDRLVQHVGVADDDVAVQADRLPRIAGRVAVEGEGTQAELARVVELEQFGDLVLGQRLGREQVERLGLPRHRRGDHGEGVAQALAGSGRRDHHHVLALAHGGPGLGLMAVELVDAAGFQRGGEGGRQVSW